MTKQQERKLEMIKNQAIRMLGAYTEELQKNYEIKKFDVDESYETLVSVFLVVGSKGDEGTLAQSLCRKKVNLQIGKKGGISFINKNFNKQKFDVWSYSDWLSAKRCWE